MSAFQRQNVTWYAITAVGVSMVATAAWSQAQAPAPEDPAVETFATLPSADGTETSASRLTAPSTSP